MIDWGLGDLVGKSEDKIDSIEGGNSVHIFGTFHGILSFLFSVSKSFLTKNCGDTVPAPIKSNNFFCSSLSFNLFSNNGAEILFSNKNFSYFNL